MNSGYKTNSWIW